ncbi:methyltransferase, FxLD system [Streptomyces qinzhouensis]|uniref:Protein-L-isoaspartate O-methyltransferase n=1 Tax=Streptomyces qinzhouensis TaxID=2599401 RepID=A0A5B8J847_9ACTN|nr:methyltransferase, FxLD system [Streptomyces qinzhouensis]
MGHLVWSTAPSVGDRPTPPHPRQRSYQVTDLSRTAQLREEMIEELKELKAVRTAGVEAALRKVPRHVFAPGVPLEKVYAAEYAVITKKDEDGVHISSVSASRVQALMLEQAEIGPGDRVLEIGSGGLNAAYIAELVGESGEVTTADIDPDITDRAKRFLTQAGYERVNVVLADGEGGVPEHAPYDKIVVTVGAWDIPPAWVEQLAEGGRIVVPLRMRGLTRSVAFNRVGDRLISREYELCGFVPMQGVGENRMRLVPLHDEEGAEVALKLDDGQQVDGGRLRDALHQPRTEVWTGITIGGFESNDNLDLWLATALDGFTLLSAKPGARERGIVASVSPIGVATLVDGDSFAYRTVRPTSEERTLFEFGVYGHGPDADKVAQRLADEIQTWDREHRADRARIEAYTRNTSDDLLPAGRVIDKRHTRITISWP